MKNVKLSVKLIGAFCGTALLILVVGLISIRQQQHLQLQMTRLNEEAIPAIQYIQGIKQASLKIASEINTILSPYITREQRQAVNGKLDKVRKGYAGLKEQFIALPVYDKVKPQWEEFDRAISQWAGINNEALQLSNELISAGVTNPEVLADGIAGIKFDHEKLLAGIGRLMLVGVGFKGGENATDCTLGKWLASPPTTNPEIIALFDTIRPVHNQFHAAIKEVKELMAAGDRDRALSVVKTKFRPAEKKLMALLIKMEEKIAAFRDRFAKMNELLLTGAADAQKTTFIAIDQLIAAVNANEEQMAAAAKKTAATDHTIILIGIALGVGLALLSGFWLTRMITVPLSKGVELAKAIAAGDMTKSLDIDRGDEPGILATALNTMAGGLRTTLGDIRTEVTQVDDSSRRFASIAKQMASGAEETAGRSAQVAAAAEKMSSNQGSVAAAMEEAAVNVNMVASAAEEMKSTITEISENSSRAQQITSQAVSRSNSASERVNELGNAADEINKVTETITEISEQTNLLALNATIEAARAGEAGKGFAVVANEIKDLAGQTATATLDIRDKIQGIQHATGVTVSEIEEISRVIAEVDQMVTTIATAVEEQSATTSEIVENITQVSSGISEVNRNVAQNSSVTSGIASDIASVNASADKMNTSSSEVHRMADELAQVSEKLKTMIERFQL